MCILAVNCCRCWDITKCSLRYPEISDINFVVLAGMPQLEHLNLDSVPTLGAENIYDLEYYEALSSNLPLSAFQSLTASTQLTYLNLGCWQPLEAHCCAVFPRGRQLPHLISLCLGPCFFATADTTQHVLASCPNVTSLRISAESPEHIDYEDALHVRGTSHFAALARLTQVGSLINSNAGGTAYRSPCA